jgi:hypothetical protein
MVDTFPGLQAAGNHLPLSKRIAQFWKMCRAVEERNKHSEANSAFTNILQKLYVNSKVLVLSTQEFTNSMYIKGTAKKIMNSWWPSPFIDNYTKLSLFFRHVPVHLIFFAC